MIQFKKHQIGAVVLSAATICSIPLAPLVLAEESLALEEVLVTARKRMESMQDAPLAVSAITGDMLINAGITNLADITEMVPNLQISRPSKDASVYIRGVGPTRGATNVTELSVGVYIDDVFMLKPHGQLIDLAEIESVQVLRGPQGTLFGKNTTGGAMVVTTVKPREEFGGFGQMTVGNDGRLNVQASVDVPISDSFLTKLTLTSVKVDGIAQDPVHGTELSNEDRQGAFLQMRWLASENVTADFSFFHNRIRENLSANGDCVVTNLDSQIIGRGLISPVTGRKLMNDFCEEASEGAATYYEPDPSRKFELDASQASMNIAWDINENHSMSSITAWRNQETPGITYTNTYAGFPAGQRALKNSESTQFSQEFQLTGEFLDSRLRYTAGLYYMQDDSDTGLTATWNGHEGIWAASIAPGLPSIFVAALSNYNEVGVEGDNSVFAIYNQWSWDMTENLELTAGLRYGYEKREVKTQRTRSVSAQEAYADIPGAIILPTVVLMTYDTFFSEAMAALPLPLDETEYLEDNDTYSSLTPMVTAAYHFPQEMLSDSINSVMMYASYTEGYKAGGFSDFAVGELIPYEEEGIDSIEIGMKLDAWDNRLRINAALFTMDYDNMQLFIARPDPDSETIGSLQGVVNAGASTIEGVELEVSLVPAANWLINMSASFANGEFEQFDDFIVDAATGKVIPQDRSDEDLPSLPESSFSLGVQYDWDTRFGSWTARVDAFYRDEIYWGFDAMSWDNTLARKSATTDSYTVYNGRLNWQIDDNLSVSAWGKNLGDKVYYDGGVGEAVNLGIVNKGFAMPRRYGVDLRYQF